MPVPQRQFIVFRGENFDEALDKFIKWRSENSVIIRGLMDYEKALHVFYDEVIEYPDYLAEEA